MSGIDTKWHNRGRAMATFWKGGQGVVMTEVLSQSKDRDVNQLLVSGDQLDSYGSCSHNITLS
jgi:hypothetical protein